MAKTDIEISLQANVKEAKQQLKDFEKELKKWGHTQEEWAANPKWVKLQQNLAKANAELQAMKKNLNQCNTPLSGVSSGIERVSYNLQKSAGKRNVISDLYDNSQLLIGMGSEGLSGVLNMGGRIASTFGAGGIVAGAIAGGVAVAYSTWDKLYGTIELSEEATKRATEATEEYVTTVTSGKLEALIDKYNNGWKNAAKEIEIAKEKIKTLNDNSDSWWSKALNAIDKFGMKIGMVEDKEKTLLEYWTSDAIEKQTEYIEQQTAELEKQLKIAQDLESVRGRGETYTSEYIRAIESGASTSQANKLGNLRNQYNAADERAKKTGGEGATSIFEGLDKRRQNAGTKFMLEFILGGMSIAEFANSGRDSKLDGRARKSYEYNEYVKPLVNEYRESLLELQKTSKQIKDVKDAIKNQGIPEKEESKLQKDYTSKVDYYENKGFKLFESIYGAEYQEEKKKYNDMAAKLGVLKKEGKMDDTEYTETIEAFKKQEPIVDEAKRKYEHWKKLADLQSQEDDLDLNPNLDGEDYEGLLKYWDDLIDKIVDLRDAFDSLGETEHENLDSLYEIAKVGYKSAQESLNAEREKAEAFQLTGERIGTTTELFGSASSALSNLSSESKAAAAATKALAVAEQVAALASAIHTASAGGDPYTVAIRVAAAAAGVTGAIISAASTTKKYANGGVLTGGSGVGDYTTFQGKAGEVIFNDSQFRNLNNYIASHQDGNSGGYIASTRISGTDLQILLNRTSRNNSSIR